ncbi:hypothetical protein BaRGS_00009623 [Batillaria attramentaria]|uniref:NACHT domain-containing protein n=1 Tax=Batillaria attramentaria TaxID=370345 RepID=A0ABD0LHT6_9CAEN
MTMTAADDIKTSHMAHRFLVTQDRLGLKQHFTVNHRTLDFSITELTEPLRYRHLENGDEPDTEQISARGKRKAAPTRAQQEARLRYTHLKNEDYDMVTSLMQGSLPLSDVPTIKSKVIKLFISSTFTDFVVERNVLQEQVFPKIRKYCRDKYGVDFQAVDMRWGVALEAQDDHSVLELCLAELSHCQTISIGPNFALLLGQKYGHCPAPPVVPRFQFETVRTHLVDSGRDVTVLDLCYQRDANVTPSVYRLLNISKIQELTDVKWAETEAKLKQLITDGAKLAVAGHDLKADDLRRLTASVTEHETYQGLMEVNTERGKGDNCVMFVREIGDLLDNLDKNLAKRFCDVIPGTTAANSNAQAALTNLKAACQKLLPRFNYGFGTVSWTEQGIDTEVHKDYIDRVCEHFYHTTRALVDRNMMRHDQLTTDDLYHEVAGHWAVAASRCSTFVGREVPLMGIRQYITEESSQALVVYGQSGVGKTSFLAKVASLAQGWTSEQPSQIKTSVILRFIGITPKCSSIQQLLHSICHQIAFVAGRNRLEVPEDYKSLKMYFIDLLQRGEVPGMLVIILDSLDQLSAGNGAHKLDWLPARIAPNIKVIMSTIPGKHGILDRLKNKVQDSVMQLPPLPATDAERIMKVLLEATNRQVTLPQWRIVQEAFQHCTLPLFITLTFQEASRWRSYDEIAPGALQHTVEAAIEKLFERLEAKHGRMFVSRALAYITAARRGLSESELEDVLSLDDDVLNAVFTMWLPPVRRVPPSLWPRLYLDIAAFLVERDADDVVVLSWYHQQFVDAATTRYLSCYVDYVQVHRTLADYYTGTWSGSAQKPFTFNKQLMDRLKLTDPQGKACRYVPDMPLIFMSSEVSERFNLRKMSQLPYSLLHSRQFDRLRSDCFCNYQWLHAKLRATSVQHVLADFALLDDRETDLVADVFRMADSALKHDPDRLGAEISGRLLPHVARYQSVRELVRQCDLAAQMCCPLVPIAQLYAAPGGPLQYECDLKARSAVDVDVFSSPDGILLTAKSYYSTCLKVWELSQGEPRQDMHLPVGAVHPSSDGRYLTILKDNRHVSIYKADCGELHGHVDYEYGEVGAVATGKKYLAISVDRGVGPIVVDLEEARLVHRFAFHSHAVAFSSDETLFAFNTGTLVILYSLPLMERKCVGQVNEIPQMLQFTGHQTKCFLLTQTKMLKSIYFDIVSRKHYNKDIICDLDLRDFTLSHKQNLLLCRSARCLYVIDAHRERLVHRLQRAPDKVLSETLTTFSGAGFTPDDRLVVAARYNHLFVWNANSGQPVRVLQAALCPVVKLFMSPATNKAVTLLKDNTLQVFFFWSCGVE